MESKPRKIGIVSEYFYPHLGGITEHVYYSAKEFLKRGYEVVLLTGYEGEAIDVEIPSGLRIIHLGKSVQIFSNDSYARVTLGWNLGKKIQRVLEEEKFDLLHIHSPSVMVLPFLFGKYTNTTTIGTIHTYFDSMSLYKIFAKQCQAYISKLDGLIAVAPSCIDAMSRYFQLGETITIPNGVEADWFSHPNGKIDKFNDGSPNILFLGRLDPRNGLDTLIESIPAVLQSLPNARLIVVGDGKLRPFYEYMAGSLLNKKIFFEGAINGTRPEYFATSQTFCYPATKASFGITLLEAMAAGTPVVASDNRGLRDLIQDGHNGLLAPQNDSNALAKTLVRVLTDSALSKKLKTNGQKTAHDFSWSHIADQVLAYYNKIYLQKKGIPFAP